MRIAVACDDGMRVAAHTGRCGGFVIYDVSGVTVERVEYRTNSFTTHARGGCSGDHRDAEGGSSHGPLLEALADCGALVTRGLGPRLVADLAAHGIEAYVCDTESADEAAALYARGQLARAPGRGCCCH